MALQPFETFIELCLGEAGFFDDVGEVAVLLDVIDLTDRGASLCSQLLGGAALRVAETQQVHNGNRHTTLNDVRVLTTFHLNLLS